MNEYEALVKLNGQGKTKVLGVKPVPVPLRQPQVSGGLVWNQPWVCTLRSWQICPAIILDTWLSRGRVVNSCDTWFELPYKIVVPTLFFPCKMFGMCVMPNFQHGTEHMLNCRVLLLTSWLSSCHCLIYTHFIETVAAFFTNLENLREMSTYHHLNMGFISVCEGPSCLKTIRFTVCSNISMTKSTQVLKTYTCGYELPI